MKTENKMTELKIAALAAHIAEETAQVYRDSRWEIYLEIANSRNIHNYNNLCSSYWDIYWAANDVLKASKIRTNDADNAVNDYEVGEYETNPYEPEDE